MRGAIDIRGVTADSRAVRPGFLFAALPGSRADGRLFIPDALRAGAAAVLAPLGTTLDASDIPLIIDANPRRRLALIAAKFHGRQPKDVVAVTGTNGKTSVAWFAREIARACGRQAASLGTLGLVTDRGREEGGMTTPDPVALHATLAALATKGTDFLAMEASSHGLDQYRLDGVEIGAAAFTNITRDHLDYHANFDAYFRAKLRLFTEVMHGGRVAVLNADLPEFPRLVAACRDRSHRVMRFGTGPGHELRLIGRRLLDDGQILELEILGRHRQVELRLIGEFQAMNVLAALGLALAAGLDTDRAVNGLTQLTGVPGRVQTIGRTPRGGTVVVDYAHTPDALANVLAALRPHAEGRLVALFGCGGDRDRGKRPLMGQIAAERADLVFVTDDNPRSETPAAIRREILAACPRAVEIGDRRAAIRAAVTGLEAGDLLVIAGKGHEQGQIVGATVRPFDDAVEAKAAITALKGGKP